MGIHCTLCRDTGWLLDTKDRGGIVTMEVYRCLIPDCVSSGQSIRLLSLDTMRFKAVIVHPTEGYVMSLKAQ